MCNTFVNTYVPQPHQLAVHKDSHTFIGNFGGFGTGKGQPNTTPIPTPTGIKLMGELKVGDYVFGSDGLPVRIIGIFPQGVKLVYKLTFSGGASTCCDEDHLWTYTDPQHNRRHTKPLKYMLRFGLKTPKNTCRYTVQFTKPVAYPEKVLPLDAYVLGVLLGDGCLRDRGFTISGADEELIAECARILGTTYKRRSKNNFSWDFAVSKAIVPEELCNRYSHEKYIPEEYLTASIEQRFALLQGLMDTDGSVFLRNDGAGVLFAFATNSTQLKDNFITLVRSLGMRATAHWERDSCWELRLTVPHELREKVFRLSRKKALAISHGSERKVRELSLLSVEQQPDAECTCIKVANEDGLYVTEDYIVTHNTTTSRQEVIKHMIITPNANVLVGANVSSQYEQTIKRELENDLPIKFVRDSSAQKAYIDLINGSRIMFRPFDDPDKLRSYNLTMFVIVEASQTTRETFSQLKTRLRNMNASEPERDENGDVVYEITESGVQLPKTKFEWTRGLVESNPDSGWVRSDVLLVSDSIALHGRIADKYDVPADQKDPDISSHVASTDVNRFLPKDFIPRNTKNKPAWWVARNIYGSFTYAAGLVYPAAGRMIVPYFDVPSEWLRMLAFDYGLADIAAFVYGALDDRDGIFYVYKEQRTENRNVAELASMFREGTADIPIGGWFTPPIIDPKSAPKRDYNKKSLADHFADHNIVFQPGHINVDARVFRLNTYLEAGRIKIMDSCPGLNGELREYKFKDRTLDNKVGNDKPIDKDNHSINCLEWMAMMLPPDPRLLSRGAFNRFGMSIDSARQQKGDWLPYALQDPPARWDDAETIFGMAPMGRGW